MSRPLGISILAVLHAIGGVGILAVLLFLVGQQDVLAKLGELLGFPVFLIILGILIVGGLSLASCVGMWKGTRWGWWVTSFYYMYSVVRYANALLFVSFFAQEDLGATDQQVLYHSVKFGGRIIVHLLIYLYLFKTNVLEYFGLEELSVVKAVGIHLGICGSLFAAFTLFQYLAG